jgi:putative transposase
MLNVIDDYSRECLACIVDTSLSGRRVVRELATIAERRGLPCTVVSDNPVLSEVEGGTALTSHAVLAWCQDTGVAWHYIAPGKALLSLSKGRSRMALWNRSMGACATSA